MSLEVYSPSKPHSLTDCLTHRGKCYQQTVSITIHVTSVSQSTAPTVQTSTLRLEVNCPGLLSRLPLQSHRFGT